MTSRDFQIPGRSPVLAASAMCATSHPLASEAAIGVLRRGGNAVDAAITAAAVLAVVEPAMTGIAGDCFAIIAKPGRPLIGINGSGRAPAGIDAERLRAEGGSIAEESPAAITVPGAIDAWDRLLAAHGTISLGEALQPAIVLAEQGAPVHPRVALDWSDHVERLNLNPGARALYTKDGKAFEIGDRHRQPQLAETMRLIAEQGRDAFYCGEIAQRTVAFLQALGGVHTMADFAACAADWVEPVVRPYRGIEIAELPPNTQGVTVQLILGILEQFDLAALAHDSAERFHLELEAARSAYRFRDAFIADAAAMSVSVDQLLDKGLARQLASKITPGQRTGDLGPVRLDGSDTVYLTVVDRDWMAVSFINSIYHAFGSRIADPETGLLFHSRGSCFVLDEGHPNCIAPNKRPMHTIIPGMALRNGRADLSFGVMGAAFQPIGQAHVVSNVYDYGMDIQAAIDHPRMFWKEGKIAAERDVSEATLRALADYGHDVGPAVRPWGGGQGIMLDWERGVLIGGSDPRKDGLAIGF